ncbi:MAG: SDR family oxidoreductase [Candidatus Lokiarchaeota archaeon]|nr:SDR family oxidoreductase [Candidatus Lokiarchaeota archaeon]MBD3342142.1 SDR family oxidoreductase [Candidatus Lokiarchaeota archaeon]
MVEKFLEDKGAVITGGASGFGRGAAYAFAERGADVVLVDVNKQLLEETAKKVASKTGRKVVPIVCDVSNSNQVDAMAKKAGRELDNIYILFNNAGIGVAFGRNICRVKEEDWDKIMSVNLKGQWLVAKAFWRKMKSNKFEPIAGKIICNASVAGINLSVNIPSYSITKAGVIALSKILAKTLAPKITSNAIAPGFHVTGIYLNDENVVNTVITEEKADIKLERLGTVDDVVKLVVFLASPGSDYITGEVIKCDGGTAIF